ncbi:conserved hypothetical protein [Frankia canadensis]|uniref:Cytochrome P450 n=1 Tax=Frankia canadensis TaxID=1836972 RepID=A0A2I2KI54_9ACTN|nr:cytochrome P450 [Frankia canadensis]SNQ45342.1 conserved hypothetical protein [Frankia canadensis]SOU52632.1 conserved hypothetical protein [Frankia canadensis]
MDRIALGDAKTQFESRCPAFLADPAPALHSLRTASPVYFSDALGAWVVSRAADVTEVLRDRRNFTSVGSMTSRLQLEPDVIAEVGEDRAGLRNFLANTDAPRHTRLRSAVARGLTPRAVARLEGVATASARSLALRMRESIRAAGPRGVDLKTSFASPLAGPVMGELIGLPGDDLELVTQWVGDWFSLYRYRLTREEQLACARNLRAYDSYVTALVQRYEREPGDNLISDVLRGVTEGQYELSHREIVDIVANVIVGGLHTTASAVAAVTLRLLSTSGAWADLVTDPTGVEPAIEECLRLEGVSFAAVRTVTRPVRIGGVLLRPGEKVHAVSRAADLDPAKFQEPDEYRPSRENVRRHLVYGNGPHTCIGAPLARVELRCALHELVTVLPGLELVELGGVHEYLASPNHRQLRELRVTVRSPNSAPPPPGPSHARGARSSPPATPLPTPVGCQKSAWARELG